MVNILVLTLVIHHKLHMYGQRMKGILLIV
jgi:hypothetical protein